MMPVSFVGVLVAGNLRGGPETTPIPYARELAQAYERAGFESMLIGWGSTAGDGIATAGYLASVTERLRFVVAHRTGFIAPTVAARMLATLDHFSGGRITLHVISGGNDAEQRRDGDWIDHDARYRRTGEYLDIVRRIWADDEPFDYLGEFYRVSNAASVIKPLQPALPIFFGGSSPIALSIGAKHADNYVLYAEPLAGVRTRIEELRKAAEPFGRNPSLGLTIRVILGDTEEAAWQRAFGIRERFRPLAVAGPANPEGVGYVRSYELAQQHEVYDERLWTGITRLTGGRGESTALVGTAEQVAQSLLAYHDLGITVFFLQGFDGIDDVAEQGERLLPLVRTGVADRNAARSLTAVPRGD